MSNMDDVYIGTALLYSRKSKAVRAKVGAVIVTETGILLPGINGTASGTDNKCEDDNGFTKIETIHAELNCIGKSAREGVSIKGATLYVTLSPCRHCAAVLMQVGIQRVVYLNEYRDLTGISFLSENGVKIEKYKYEHESHFSYLNEKTQTSHHPETRRRD